MVVGLVEGDELLMQVCMSVTERKYYIVFNSGQEKFLGFQYYSNGRFNRYLVDKNMKRLGKVKDKDYFIKIDLICNDKNKGIFLINKKLSKWYNKLNLERIDIWVGPTNKSNFRYKIAKTLPYKGNREEKPVIHGFLRSYLIETLGAQVIEGHESDDALGMFQTDNTIAIHCDKDIDQIPGNHFNTMTGKGYFVEDPGTLYLGKDNKSLKGTGIAFFYAQLLMGDRVDNIPSVPHTRYKGWGPKSTYELLRNCKDESEYLKEVMTVYKNNVGSNWKERLYEQADLVWICREKGITGSVRLADNFTNLLRN